jgi:hypothetical protein
MYFTHLPVESEVETRTVRTPEAVQPLVLTFSVPAMTHPLLAYLKPLALLLTMSCSNTFLVEEETCPQSFLLAKALLFCRE